jgi:hypothetical protein
VTAPVSQPLGQHRAQSVDQQHRFRFDSATRGFITRLARRFRAVYLSDAEPVDADNATAMPTTPPRSNDEVRDLILRHLYDSHRTTRGRSGGALTISELQKAMRPLGLKQQDVGHNLDYLVQKGWVREVVKERAFTTARGTRQSAERVTFKISEVGIDRIEAASTYQRPPTTSGVNITNIHGVTIVGDGNVVNTSFTELSKTLADARQVVLSSSTIPEPTKLDIVADIDTLQGQLQKPMPRREVVSQVWEGLQKLLTVAGLVELATKIGDLIRPLLT